MLLSLTVLQTRVFGDRIYLLQIEKRVEFPRVLSQLEIDSKRY